MAVLEPLFCARSIWSPPYAGSGICFRRRRPSNLRLLQGFRVKVSEQLVVSQNKGSENEVKEEESGGEEGKDVFSPNALKNSARVKYKKVENEISSFLISQGLSKSEAQQLVTDLHLCIQIVTCDLFASRRSGLSREISSEILPFLKSLITNEINGDLLRDIDYLMKELNLVNMKPYLDLLTEIGGTKEIITNIILKFPRFFSLDISTNLIPKLNLLIHYGANKQKLAKLIGRAPRILHKHKETIESVLDYLHGLGLPIDRVGKVIESFPSILAYSIESLQTRVEYFQSLGVDLAKFLPNNPQSLALRLEENIKPVTKFFMEQGFTKEELSIMLRRYTRLYGRSLEKCIIPKWEFFLTMGYERRDLVGFPHYFSYSLEKRIRPRYERAVEAAVRIPFSYLTGFNDAQFDKYFEKIVANNQTKVGAFDFDEPLVL